MKQRMAVRKAADGKWEIFPIRSWFGRVILRRSYLVPTDNWVWVTWFDTHAEAIYHADVWARTPDDMAPNLPLRARSGRESSARSLGWIWRGKGIEREQPQPFDPEVIFHEP